MPASPIRRRRPVVVAVTALFALGLLAGCTGQQEPGSYGDKVEKPFLEGCWQTTVLDADPDLSATLLGDDGFEIGDDELEPKLEEAVGASEIKAAKSYCQCAYDAIAEDVKFSEFKRVTDDLREENGPLPASFQKAYAGCAKELG